MPRKLASDLEEFARVCYYGPPGKAKTTNVASMANRGSTALVAAEAGLKPTALKRRGIELANLEIFPDLDQAEEVKHEDIEQYLWDIKARLDDDPTSLYGFTFDSLTEMVKLLVEQQVKIGIEKADRKGLERSQFEIYVEDYGVVTEQVRIYLRMLKDMPIHVALTGHVRRDQDKDGTVRYGIATTPAIQGDVQGWCDVVCLVDSMDAPGWGPRDELFYGRMRKGGVKEAKDRFEVLPTIMVEPTMTRIIDYIEGTLTEATDPLQQEAAPHLAELERAPRVRRVTAKDAAAEAVGEEPEDGDEDPDAEGGPAQAKKAVAKKASAPAVKRVNRG